MPHPAVAIIGGSIASSAVQARSASKAGRAQTQAAEMGIQEQREARLATERLMAPYVAAGTGSLEQQQAMIGLLGPEAQTAAIQAIEVGPMFQGMVRQGEEAILQNAAATGGLRGGNTQTALAQFRPQILQSLIQDQYSKLSGITDIGQASAAGQAGFGQQSASNIGNLYGQIGQAQAGAVLGRGQAMGNLFNMPLQLQGMASQSGQTMGGFLGF